MSRDLPFGISFALPPGWSLVSPDSCGQPDAALVAVRDDNAADSVTTNLVISGYAAQDADVGALSDEYAASMGSKYPVTVVKRDILARTDFSQEAAQLLEVEFPVEGSVEAIRQIHIINAFRAVDGHDFAVLQLLMTCPKHVFDRAGPEFQQFVTSIAPVA